MTACRYYEAGYCKYGFHCRNSHTKETEKSWKVTKHANKKNSNDANSAQKPVWIETRKWRVLSELDNLSSKFRFKVPSPTTKEWSVWDSSDSEYEGDIDQLRRGKLNRLESATLFIFLCTNCRTQSLAGHSQEVLFCEFCGCNLIRIQSSNDEEGDELFQEDIEETLEQVNEVIYEEQDNNNSDHTSEGPTVMDSNANNQCSSMADPLPAKHLTKKEKKRMKKKQVKQKENFRQKKEKETSQKQNSNKETDNAKLKFQPHGIDCKESSRMIITSKYNCKDSAISRNKKVKRKKKKDSFIPFLGRDKLYQMMLMIFGDTLEQSASVQNILFIMLVIITCFNIVFFIQ